MSHEPKFHTVSIRHSRNLRLLRYSSATETLRVKFLSGAEWEYPKVPFSIVMDILAAESRGSAFATLVKSRIRGREITPATSPSKPKTIGTRRSQPTERPKAERPGGAAPIAGRRR